MKRFGLHLLNVWGELEFIQQNLNMLAEVLVVNLILTFVNISFSSHLIEN